MSVADTSLHTASSASREQTVRRMFAHLNDHDAAGLGAFHHPDIEQVSIAIGTYHGRAEVRSFFEEMFSAVPDLAIEIEGLDESGDVATIRWHLTGTFRGGPFHGIEATGRPISLRGVDVMEFDGDLLRRIAIYYDGLTFARQVGLLPAQDTPAERVMIAAFNGLTRLKRSLSRTR